MNIIRNITELSHHLALPYINRNSICIDGTIGNGNDILFLCQNCKFVYGFDIQESAVITTKQLLNKNHVSNYKIYQKSHEYILETVKEKIDFAIFNLGYLPKGDKNITTCKDTTLKAIESCFELLNNDGAIMVIIYHGHQEGKIEKETLIDYCKTLDEKTYHVGYFDLINQEGCPPEILIISKKK